MQGAAASTQPAPTPGTLREPPLRGSPHPGAVSTINTRSPSCQGAALLLHRVSQPAFPAWLRYPARLRAQPLLPGPSPARAGGPGPPHTAGKRRPGAEAFPSCPHPSRGSPHYRARGSSAPLRAEPPQLPAPRRRQPQLLKAHPWRRRRQQQQPPTVAEPVRAAGGRSSQSRLRAPMPSRELGGGAGAARRRSNRAAARAGRDSARAPVAAAARAGSARHRLRHRLRPKAQRPRAPPALPSLGSGKPSGSNGGWG